jgi:hypothetical protein
MRPARPVAPLTAAVLACSLLAVGDAVSAEPDEDFAFQGEYLGRTRTARLGEEYAGLQVAALGEGQFRAVQYRLGLPGAGWNRFDQFLLTGQRQSDTLELRAYGREGVYTITVRDGTAVCRNAAGYVVGELKKSHRKILSMGAPPPPNALVLFDGTSVDEFDSGQIVEDGLLLAGPITKRKFHDFHLHVEFRTPYMPAARGQGRGNSGVYLQLRYEVQILDSFTLTGEANECGGLYRQRRPDLNMALPPLTWQAYDIDFTAARFDSEGNRICPAIISVRHNDTLIHDNVILTGKTGAGRPERPEPGPIRFQWHGDPVHFRNIWVLEK